MEYGITIYDGDLTLTLRNSIFFLLNKDYRTVPVNPAEKSGITSLTRSCSD